MVYFCTNISNPPDITSISCRSLWCRVYKRLSNFFLDNWLTVHRSITLVDFQLDAQNPYLFTYNTFIKILYMFRALRCSSSRGLRRNCIYAASGIVTVCRWLSCAPVKKEMQFFLNRCTGQSPADMHTQTGSNSSTIAADSSNGVTNTRCCRYSCMRSWWWFGVPSETCRAVSRNKLCNVASCWIYIGMFLRCTDSRK
jgi:hypothetical protein